MLFRSVVEIYDLKNESVINIINQKDGAPRFNTNGNYAILTGIMGYSDMYVGKENIYAVFGDHSFDNIKSNKIDKKGSRFIHVDI